MSTPKPINSRLIVQRDSISNQSSPILGNSSNLEDSAILNLRGPGDPSLETVNASRLGIAGRNSAGTSQSQSFEQAAREQAERQRDGNLKRSLSEQAQAKTTEHYLYQLLGREIHLIPSPKVALDPRPNVSYEVYSPSETSLEQVRNILYRDYGIFTIFDGSRLGFDKRAYEQLQGAAAGQRFERTSDQTKDFLRKVFSERGASISQYREESLTTGGKRQDKFNLVQDNITYNVSLVSGQSSEVSTTNNINVNDAKSQVAMALKLAMTETELVRWEHHAWKFTITCESTNPKIILEFIAEARRLGAGVKVDISQIPESEREFIQSELNKAQRRHDELKANGGEEAKPPTRIPNIFRRVLRALGFTQYSSYSHIEQNVASAPVKPRSPIIPPAPPGQAASSRVFPELDQAYTMATEPSSANDNKPVGAIPPAAQTVSGPLAGSPSRGDGRVPSPFRDSPNSDIASSLSQSVRSGTALSDGPSVSQRQSSRRADLDPAAQTVSGRPLARSPSRGDGRLSARDLPADAASNNNRVGDWVDSVSSSKTSDHADIPPQYPPVIAGQAPDTRGPASQSLPASTVASNATGQPQPSRLLAPSISSRTQFSSSELSRRVGAPAAGDPPDTLTSRVSRTGNSVIIREPSVIFTNQARSVGTVPPPSPISPNAAGTAGLFGSPTASSQSADVQVHDATVSQGTPAPASLQSGRGYLASAIGGLINRMFSSATSRYVNQEDSPSSPQPRSRWGGALEPSVVDTAVSSTEDESSVINDGVSADAGTAAVPPSYVQPPRSPRN